MNPGASAQVVLDAVASTLSRLDPNARVMVAYSGGLDSTVLLHAARECLGSVRVLACHVHHGLQPLADDWARHCETQAASLGIGFRLSRLGAAQPIGQGLEAWARTERYRALWEEAARAGASVLLTAHHADDDAETLLMRLARGAGLDGLAAGVLPEMPGPAGALLLRPLLLLRRDLLQACAHAWGLSYVDDPMNTDESYFRVAIRREVMPALARVAPAFVANAARARRLLGEAQQALREVSQTDLAATVLPRAADEPPALDRTRLRALSPARRAWAVRLWLHTLQGGAPSQVQLRAWLAQMVEGDSVRGECRLGRRLFMRHRDCIEAWLADCPLSPPAPGSAGSGIPPPEFSLEYRGEERLALAGWHGCLRVFTAFDASVVDRPVVDIRLRVSSAPGELSVAISARRSHRSLRKWWQERSVPPVLRPWLPMVSDERGRALYVAGLGQVHGAANDAASPIASLRFAFEPELPQDPRRPFVRSE